MTVTKTIILPLLTATTLVGLPSLAMAEAGDSPDDAAQEHTASTYDDAEAATNSQPLIAGDGWALSMGGYVRAGYTQIQADPNFEFYGRNDGFSLDDARLVTRVDSEHGLGAVIGLDAGSRLVRTSPDSPVEELGVRMTDAYLYYRPLPFLELNAGQFKAPFDAEDLVSAADLLFVNRSVFNRGVRDVEGFNKQGLSQDRQVGIQARGHYQLDAEGFGVSYAAALANGNGPNTSLNENDNLAIYGRLNLHWDDIVTLGGGVFTNDRTVGDLPDQTDRETWGWTADLRLEYMGATIFANIAEENRELPEIGTNPDTSAMGFQVQAAYEILDFGIQPAYRFARFEDDEFANHDSVTHQTIGLNYNAPDYPLRLMANYTLISEDGEPEIDNDRFDVLVQLEW